MKLSCASLTIVVLAGCRIDSHHARQPTTASSLDHDGLTITDLSAIASDRASMELLYRKCRAVLRSDGSGQDVRTGIGEYEPPNRAPLAHAVEALGSEVGQAVEASYHPDPVLGMVPFSPAPLPSGVDAINMLIPGIACIDSTIEDWTRRERVTRVHIEASTVATPKSGIIELPSTYMNTSADEMRGTTVGPLGIMGSHVHRRTKQAWKLTLSLELQVVRSGRPDHCYWRLTPFIRGTREAESRVFLASEFDATETLVDECGGRLASLFAALGAK